MKLRTFCLCHEFEIKQNLSTCFPDILTMWQISFCSHYHINPLDFRQVESKTYLCCINKIKLVSIQMWLNPEGHSESLRSDDALLNNYVLKSQASVTKYQIKKA